jgi:hypothetical protein
VPINGKPRLIPTAQRFPNGRRLRATPAAPEPELCPGAQLPIAAKPKVEKFHTNPQLGPTRYPKGYERMVEDFYACAEPRPGGHDTTRRTVR